MGKSDFFDSWRNISQKCAPRSTYILISSRFELVSGNATHEAANMTQECL